MSDDASQPTPDSGQKNTAGKPLPFFAKSGRPSPFSLSDMNRLITRINALSNVKIIRQVVDPLPDGSLQNTGVAKLSDTDLAIILSDYDSEPAASDDGGGGVSVVPMQIVSYTVGNDYLSAKFGSFSGGAFTPTGSAINVALPWILRSAQNPTVTDQPWAIWPSYATSGIIHVASTAAGDNGVTVSGSELAWMDLGSGRTWLLPPQKVDYSDASCAAVHRYVLGGAEASGS